MVGKEFFEEQLKDIYEFSLIKYYYGEGSIINNGSEKNVYWELCLDIKGHINLVLTSNEKLELTDDNNCFLDYCMLGLTSDEEFIIEFDKIVIHYRDYKSEQNSYIYYAVCNNIGMKKKSKYKKEGFTIAKAYINNFNYTEAELKTYKCDKETYKGIKVELDNRDFKIKLHPNNKEIMKNINNKRLQHAVLSIIEIEVNANEDISSILKEVNSICWFLGLITVNMTFASLIELYHGEELVYIGMNECVKEEYHGNYLIPNNYENNGIKKIIEQSYYKYKELQDKIEINKVITFIQRVQVEKYIEPKFAILIIAYEYLLSRYLILRGVEEKKVKNLNIQQKIRRINEEFKFIPKRLSGDNLRDSIRNPLFHQGIIPFMSFEMKVEYFNEYYNLLIQIILKMLGYSGFYISRVNYKPEELK